jgi:hypothetical protein
LEDRVISFGKRVSFAFKSFFSLLGSGELPREVVEEVARVEAPAAIAPAAPAPPAEAPADRAVQLLGLLQRDGRLVDFLEEEIAGYSDEQIGAAVRAVHASCRDVLERYFTLAPVVESAEGERVSLGAEIDPGSIKVVGNQSPGAEVKGTLRHRGWRVVDSRMPPLAEGEARTVVAPAEVEL